MGSHWRGLGLILSSCSGELLCCLLPWESHQSHLQEQREAPGTGLPAVAVGQPGGDRNACGIFQRCPKLLLQALGAVQEDRGILRFFWSQTLIPCRGNLPLGRSGYKASMSGTVLRKAGSCVRAQSPCSAHCPSLHPSQHSRESCVPACAMGAASSPSASRNYIYF